MDVSLVMAQIQLALSACVGIGLAVTVLHYATKATKWLRGAGGSAPSGTQSLDAWAKDQTDRDMEYEDWRGWFR